MMNWVEDDETTQIERAIMLDLLDTPIIRSGAALVILCVLIAAAYYGLSSFRDYVVGDQETASDVLANLQEMHRNGDITDEEFRTIQVRSQNPSLDEVNSDSMADATTAFARIKSPTESTETPP